MKTRRNRWCLTWNLMYPNSGSSREMGTYILFSKRNACVSWLNWPPCLIINYFLFLFLAYCVCLLNQGQRIFSLRSKDLNETMPHRNTRCRPWRYSLRLEKAPNNEALHVEQPQVIVIPILSTAGYHCHVVVQADGLAGVAVCDRDYPSRVALSMLRELLQGFAGTHSYVKLCSLMGTT